MIHLDTDIQIICMPKCIKKLVTIQEDNDEVNFVKVKILKKQLQEYLEIVYKNEEWTLIEVNYNQKQTNKE